MGDAELLEMLSRETGRRTPAVIDGVREMAASGEADPSRVESLRVEVHGLKGAAMVVGQTRLADLARELEQALADRAEAGTIPAELAETLVDATAAFREGATAASRGDPEPPSVQAGLAALAGG
jgi:HPt (histidine-containing phosphotransfer) domain-containing protein